MEEAKQAVETAAVTESSKKVELRGVESVSNKKELVVKKPLLVRLREFFSRATIARLQEEGKDVLSLLSFFGLVLLFLIESMTRVLTILPGAKRAASGNISRFGGRVFEKLASKLESSPGHIRRSVLINLAFRNMRVKKTRAFVTVGGMAVGIAAIVFLVSLGYGVQMLVVSRVARLDELKMADITVGAATNLRFDKEAVETITHMPDVSSVLPMVSLVGKVKFAGGLGETIVQGVTQRYLELSGLKKIEGEYFETADNNYMIDTRVAGASREWKFAEAIRNEVIREITFNIEPENYLKVREAPSLNAKIIGYTQRVGGGLSGVEVWGDSYEGVEEGRAGKTASDEIVGKWVKAAYPIWEKEGGEYRVMYDSENNSQYKVQEWREGYVAELAIAIEEEEKIAWIDSTDYSFGLNVLGEASESAQTASGSAAIAVDQAQSEASISAVVVGRDENGVEWVSLGGESSQKEAEVMIIDTPTSNQKQAVVNKQFLSLLGIEEGKAVGTPFEISFVILNTLKPDLAQTAESSPTNYLIAAVVDEGTSPLIYVPLGDIEGLGTTNYSQGKVLVAEKEQLSKVRQQIENLGYQTGSVADTVAQIDKLFGTVRAVLASFGLVALSVASLGMFNTLTVSLMERTREVGVMKAMGMRSGEVKELFLAEAMIMGLLGGVFGIFAGWAFGKLLGLILSAFSLMKGVGWIDITYVPWQFVVFILVLSFVVGVLTGIYPARRARKISALNALRYE